MPAGIARERLQGLIFAGAAAGLIAHALLVAAFLAVGALALAIASIGSVLLFAACMQLARTGREHFATTLIQVGVLAHASLAVWYLGWDSGFHYYVFCLIPPVIAMPGRTAWRVLCLAISAGGYVALEAVAAGMSPVLSLEPERLDSFRSFNIGVSLAILSYLVLALRGAIIRAEHRLTDIATTDLLSGLFTRRHGLYLINREMARCARTGAPLAFVLADIDDFKQVNDRHGHEIGDHLVAAIGRRLDAGVRKEDMVARWGGDEFLMILPGLDGPSARATAERVQQSVARDPVHVDDLELRVGMTCGVTEYSPGDTVEDCVRAADAALYDGKRMGRNQVVLATPMRPRQPKPAQDPSSELAD